MFSQDVNKQTNKKLTGVVVVAVIVAAASIVAIKPIVCPNVTFELL